MSDCTSCHNLASCTGLSEHERRFIFSAAVIIIAISIVKLVLEVVQFIQLRLDYVLDWVNWMEVLIFVCSIVFVWVFHTGCLCPFDWQWQLGAVAIFLGWIDLIVFIQKFPLTGIYVLMFVNILYTFLRTVMLSFLLVIAFSLTFYMAFFEPGITVSTQQYLRRTVSIPLVLCSPLFHMHDLPHTVRYT